MEKASKAGKCLYLWVEAMVVYNEVWKQTEPIRIKLEEVSEVLRQKTEYLQQKKKALETSTKRLKQLEELYNEKINFKEDL